MNVDFTEALHRLGEDAAFRVANAARPPGRYLFNTFLPERTKDSYSIKQGTMEITPTMAGLTGQDASYFESGHIKMTRFLEESAKMSSQVSLSEGHMREIQNMVQKTAIQGGDSVQQMATEAMKFLNLVVIQSHLDLMEYLRGKALVNGKIDETIGNSNLTVDYGVPSDHFLAEATGNEAYDQSSSTFWDDHITMLSKLRYNVRAVVGHIDTLLSIINNSANNFQIISQQDQVFELVRLVGNNERQSNDARERLTMIGYDEEGEVIDPSNPDQTINVPFMPKKKLLYIARNERSGYRVGEGAQDDPRNDMELGYTHLAPTVEAGGQSGRWARLYTPEDEPWKLVGQGVTNGLPVVENPDKIGVLSTEIDGS